MTRQHRIWESLKSIAGGALVGLGLHIWFGKLHGIANQLTDVFGTSAGDTLGLVPSVILAAAHAGRVYASDHQGVFVGCPPNVDIILAAASRLRRSGIVAGCIHG